MVKLFTDINEEEASWEVNKCWQNAGGASDGAYEGKILDETPSRESPVL